MARKKRKSYSYSERGKYHAMVAKEDSVNPKTGMLYLPEQRAYSRGWLTKQKQSNKAFMHNNPNYVRKTK